MELSFTLSGLASTTAGYIANASPVIYLIMAIFIGFFIFEIFTGEDGMTTHDEWV